VEPTTPCATNTLERTPTFKQLHFSGRGATRQWSNQGKPTRGEILGSNNQLSTQRGGSSSSQFKMAGQYPTIRLPGFRGEALEDPKKHLFICEEKQITNEDTKLTQLDITLRDRALD
jgi:hypothetical protein